MTGHRVRVGTFDRVGDVAGGQAFPCDRLVTYCAERLPGFVGPLDVGQFHGGASNPTFLLTDTGTGRRYVMRKKPAGRLLPSAHAVEREYRIMAALAESAVAVPPMLLLCEDEAIVGTSFYLMPFLDGRIYADNLMADMAPADRSAAYRAVAGTLAAIHAVDPAAVGLADLGRGGNYFERQINRWTRQYGESRTTDIPAMDRLMALLPERIPAEDSVALVHGDFRLENVMFAADAPQVLAVLDWELTTLGHPLADVAFFCLFYHADFTDWGSNATIDFDASGIPREEVFLDHYCRAAGRGKIEDWAFYLGFSAFRLAAIAQGIEKRANDGIGPPLRDPRSNARNWSGLALELLNHGR